MFAWIALAVQRKWVKSTSIPFGCSGGRKRVHSPRINSSSRVHLQKISERYLCAHNRVFLPIFSFEITSTDDCNAARTLEIAIFHTALSGFPPGRGAKNPQWIGPWIWKKWRNPAAKERKLSKNWSLSRHLSFWECHFATGQNNRKQRAFCCPKPRRLTNLPRTSWFDFI